MKVIERKVILATQSGIKFYPKFLFPFHVANKVGAEKDSLLLT